MATSTFPTVTTGVTVQSATNGAINGDGSAGNKLAVGVDGVTIDVNGSNQLEVKGGGSDTEVLFNNAGAIDGMTGSSWDDTTRTLTLTGLSGGSEIDLNNALSSSQIILYRDDHNGSIGITGDDGDINIDAGETETFIAGRGAASDFQVRPFHFGNGGQILKLTGFDRGGSAYRAFIAIQNGDNVLSDIPTCTISQPGANGILAVIPPTSDPHVAGAIWNNAGTLTFSMG